MASIINASTASGGGLVQTADASGILALQSNGTTIASIDSTGVSISGSTSGAIKLAATAVAGSNTLTLPATTGTLVTLGTTITNSISVATTSGTAVDFTGIPSWVKRITVMLDGVSVAGTNNVLVQLGTAGGIVATGYNGGEGAFVQTGNSVSGGALTGFYTDGGALTAAAVRYGSVIITNVTGNTWVGISNTGITSVNYVAISGASVALGGVLTTVRISSSSAFDAGTVNIFYE